VFVVCYDEDPIEDLAFDFRFQFLDRIDHAVKPFNPQNDAVQLPLDEIGKDRRTDDDVEESNDVGIR
jgi:hypothetical protein